MALMDFAKQGKITEEIRVVAEAEGVEPEFIREGIAAGTIVILRNAQHPAVEPVAIGKGLRTKVNANIGTSPDQVDLELELEKLSQAIQAGTDTVMDLSIGGDLDLVRQEIISRSSVPVGTVPIYQAVCELARQGKPVAEMAEDQLFATIRKHAQDGVDFVTVHCGVTWAAVERLRKQGRLTDVVSRGGAFLVQWMFQQGKENPLYEHYDRLLEIARSYELTLSLGDGLRPGSLADATDRPQVEELITLGELVDRARQAGVQAMVEGPGHVPLDQVPANVLLEKRLCGEAPFYLLGPLVTDVSPGYDHITGAIGGAIAAAAGADFLCYVTPSEHLRLPTPEDVREGVIAARIAGHAGDIVKGVKGARQWDDQMSRMRKALNWGEMLRLSIDPQKAQDLRRESLPSNKRVCTMCGEFCAMKVMEDIL